MSRRETAPCWVPTAAAWAHDCPLFPQVHWGRSENCWKRNARRRHWSLERCLPHSLRWSCCPSNPPYCVVEKRCVEDEGLPRRGRLRFSPRSLVPLYSVCHRSYCTQVYSQRGRWGSCSPPLDHDSRFPSHFLFLLRTCPFVSGGAWETSYSSERMLYTYYSGKRGIGQHSYSSLPSALPFATVNRTFSSLPHRKAVHTPLSLLETYWRLQDPPSFYPDDTLALRFYRKNEPPRYC